MELKRRQTEVWRQDLKILSSCKESAIKNTNLPARTPLSQGLGLQLLISALVNCF